MRSIEDSEAARVAADIEAQRAQARAARAEAIATRAAVVVREQLAALAYDASVGAEMLRVWS